MMNNTAFPLKLLASSHERHQWAESDWLSLICNTFGGKEQISVENQDFYEVTTFLFEISEHRKTGSNVIFCPAELNFHRAY